ncbi:hypothetical protein FOYG_17480 [Fusarium oxysporum NRRL 32931]|uniref:Uncharacterized protein n=1 Tax=Fusarium oxysporum NRRL 32931 TaxID=660029 RepID=W9HEC4_FUSOX|nr:hypothetical protein FOYG_17480 [Fusarium oxysporum NRRL 32931]
MDKLGTSPSARKIKPPRQYREVRGAIKRAGNKIRGWCAGRGEGV